MKNSQAFAGGIMKRHAGARREMVGQYASRQLSLYLARREMTKAAGNDESRRPCGNWQRERRHKQASRARLRRKWERAAAECTIARII